jgi:hypothetical protein
VPDVETLCKLFYRTETKETIKKAHNFLCEKEAALNSKFVDLLSLK